MIGQTVNFYDNVKDAIQYAISDKVSIVVIGLTLTFLATMENYDLSYTVWGLLINISVIILVCFESGYSSKIINETINGSDRPPIIDNVFEILKQGVEECITSFIYAILFFVVISVILIINDFFPQFFGISLVLGIIVFAVMFILIQVSVIYKSYHSGKFYKGFDFKGMARLFRKLGFWGSLFLCAVSLISQAFIFSSLFEVSFFEIGNINSFILRFLLTPICLIFSLRLVALQGRLD